MILNLYATSVDAAMTPFRVMGSPCGVSLCDAEGDEIVYIDGSDWPTLRAEIDAMIGPASTPVDESGNDLSPPAKTIREQIEAVGLPCLVERRDGGTEQITSTHSKYIWGNDSVQPIYSGISERNWSEDGTFDPSSRGNEFDIVRVIGPAT